MSDQKDQVVHGVDGIQEYDNAPPGWLMWMLYGSIVFSVLYLGWYALSFGGSDEYGPQLAGEMVQERAAVQAYYLDHPIQVPTAEILLAAAGDPAMVATGQARFAKTCAACHGDKAQGLIGPNLTDRNWIHGGKSTDIYATLVNGVPAKGMPPWGRALKPEELQALVAFLKSVQGSSPPGGKAPEGPVVEPEAL